MKSSDIRSAYLRFFEERGHKVVKSDSLVPKRDPTLLFTGAGMNQFKEMFLSEGPLPFTRATSCQKCLRTIDIDNVGKTSYHHTFFEMLGNFSFGDYFKVEAIRWAWEFVTEVLGLPKERLRVSVYEEDEEAAAVWREEIGMPDSLIARLGPEDNFWPANAPAEGPNGPCGPCSEIFYDMGEERGCGRPECGVDCDCGRFVEVWNLVFTQYDRKDGGVLEPLHKKNIDTGMGLERITSVVQGVESNFDTDLFIPIIEHICDVMGIRYDRHTEEGARIRRIADHTRAAVFCIGDGVLPGNEGRGYVLRRLIRRAMNDARMLGHRGRLLSEAAETVADVMGEVYPEVKERIDSIRSVIGSEEERFGHILERGTMLLEHEISKMKEEGIDILSGEDAFKLYDTYGVPLEVTVEILSAHGMEVDRTAFEREMDRQRERARGDAPKEIFAGMDIQPVIDRAGPTEFEGYNKLRSRATILALLGEDGEKDEVEKGEKVVVILDRSPFYGEGGGQVGDSGRLTGKGFSIAVHDTQLQGETLMHKGKVTRGKAVKGATVTCMVDGARRRAVARSHTATHMLHYALRKVLGKHVRQAGSLVEADRLRFDFTHGGAMGREEIEKVETMLNDLVRKDDPVRTRTCGMEEALREGAMALFGEKYGDYVRMVQVGRYSKELCGGTHCKRTGEVGLFRIIKEESVAAGIRRIEALVGAAAVKFCREETSLLNEIRAALKVQREGIVQRVEGLLSELKQMKQEVARLKSENLRATATEILDEASDHAGVKLVQAFWKDKDADDLRRIADFIRERMKNRPFVAALGSANAGRALLVVATGGGLHERGIDAVTLVKAVGGIIQGGGGGRPDMAQAGGKNGAAVPAAVSKIMDYVREKL